MPKEKAASPVPPEAAQTEVAVPIVPWRMPTGVIFVIASFFIAQIVGGVLLSIYPAFRHWTSSQANDWLAGSIPAQFIYMLLVDGFILLAVWYLLKRYRRSWRLIGLKRPRWRDPAYGVAALPLYFLLYAMGVTLVGELYKGLNVSQQQNIGFSGAHGGLDLALTFVSLVVLPPLTEEILVRGVLYSSLKKVMTFVWATLITSLIFAAAHLPEGGAAGPLWIAFIDTFVLSLVLCWLREKTGTLWPGITLHAIKNCIAFLALFVIH